MNWIKAAILAFSSYSRIPVPQIKWTDDAMGLALVFLPLVGAVIGVAVWCLQLICRGFGLSAVLLAAITAALPIFITGGIHLDGYCDTSDALAARRNKERGLEILKDPHVGAFALIRFGTYLLVSFALFYELYGRGADAGIIWLYPISRCFAVWSAIIIPKARQDGMLSAFTEKIGRHEACLILSLLTALAAAGWIYFTFPGGLAGLVLCLPVTLWYRNMAAKRFGGVTGDTTGYYLQITELILPAGLLLGTLLFN